MYLILRIIRGFIGLSAGFQFAGVIRSIDTLSTGGSEAITLFIIKFILLVILAGLFLGMEKLINYLYNKKHSTNHPSLKTPWSL